MTPDCVLCLFIGAIVGAAAIATLILRAAHGHRTHGEDDGGHEPSSRKYW